MLWDSYAFYKVKTFMLWDSYYNLTSSISKYGTPNRKIPIDY